MRGRFGRKLASQGRGCLASPWNGRSSTPVLSRRTEGHKRGDDLGLQPRDRLQHAVQPRSRRFSSACRSCSQISRTLESRALASASTSGRITPSFSDAKPAGSDSPRGGFESGRVSTFQQRVSTIQSVGHRLPKSPVRGRRIGPLRAIISTETPLISCGPPPQMGSQQGRGIPRRQLEPVGGVPQLHHRLYARWKRPGRAPHPRGERAVPQWLSDALPRLLTTRRSIKWFRCRALKSHHRTVIAANCRTAKAIRTRIPASARHRMCPASRRSDDPRSARIGTRQGASPAGRSLAARATPVDTPSGSEATNAEHEQQRCEDPPNPARNLAARVVVLDCCDKSPCAPGRQQEA
jgi:hypothetical protein